MRVIVRVPASTANLGPGFDCLGLALQLWNTITVQASDRVEEFHWRDCSQAVQSNPNDRPAQQSNLILRAMDEFFARVHVPAPRLRVTATDCIPIGRGLGSSAAAIVGGLMAARAWTGKQVSQEELLQWATELEGHPDNVTAALLGGLTIVVREGVKTFAVNIRPPRAWRAVLLIPEQGLETASARAVLPHQISREDAVYNIGRAALLVRAFALADPTALGLATGDRLHEPYREHLVQGMEELCHAATRAGAHGVALSGAGPSLVAFASGESEAMRVAKAFQRCARSLRISGITRVVGLAARGAQARLA